MRAAVVVSFTAKAGLGLELVSGMPQRALPLAGPGNRDIADMIFAPPPGELAIDATRFGSRDNDALMEALGAGSDWLADIACRFLLNSRDPQTGERAARRIHEVPANRRAGAAMVAVVNDPEPEDAASRFLDASDPGPRRRGCRDPDARPARGAGSWNALLNRALNDDDQTVRLAAGADPASTGRERYWSCDERGHVNTMDARHSG